MSTGHQSLDQQLDALSAAGVDTEHVYSDKLSGTSTLDQRPGLAALLDYARPGVSTDQPRGESWQIAKKDANRITAHQTGYAGVTAKAVTVRLDEADHAVLHRQSELLTVRPGTLAQMLVVAGLNQGARTPGGSEARAALDQLVQRSRQLAPADAVKLVDEARADLGAAR